MENNTKKTNTKKLTILGILLLFALALTIALPISLAETKAAERDAIPESESADVTEPATQIPAPVQTEAPAIIPETEPETEDEVVPAPTAEPTEEPQVFVAPTKTLIRSDEPLQMEEVLNILWYDTTEENFAQFLDGEGTLTVKTVQGTIVRADNEESIFESEIGTCFGMDPGYEVGTIITLYILLG